MSETQVTNGFNVPPDQDFNTVSFQGSMQQVLQENVGKYVIVEFLIGTGSLTSPLGAKLLRTSAMPAGTLIGLDKNYALEQICGSEITVEYDKLIDRQLERAAITSISGFSKLYQGASKVLEI